MGLVRIDHPRRGRGGRHVGHALHAGAEVGHPRGARHGYQGQQERPPDHRPRAAQTDADRRPQQQAAPEQPRPRHIPRCGQLRGVIGEIGPAAERDQPAHGQPEPRHRQRHRLPGAGAAPALPAATGHSKHSAQPNRAHQQMRPARGHHRAEQRLVPARHRMDRVAHGRERQLLCRRRIQRRPGQVDEGRGQPAQQHVQLRQWRKRHLRGHAGAAHAQVQADRHQQPQHQGYPVRQRRTAHHQHRRQPDEHRYAAAERERRGDTAQRRQHRTAAIPTQQHGHPGHQRRGDQIRMHRLVAMGERALAAEPEDRQRPDQGRGRAYRWRQRIGLDDPGQQPHRGQRQQHARADLQPLVALQPGQLGMAHQVRQDFAVAVVRDQHVRWPRHLQQLLGKAPRIGVQHPRREPQHRRHAHRDDRSHRQPQQARQRGRHRRGDRTGHRHGSRFRRGIAHEGVIHEKTRALSARGR